MEDKLELKPEAFEIQPEVTTLQLKLMRRQKPHVLSSPCPWWAPASWDRDKDRDQQEQDAEAEALQAAKDNAVNEKWLCENAE